MILHQPAEFEAAIEKDSPAAAEQATPTPRPASPDLTPLFMLVAAGIVVGSILSWPGLDYCPNDASRWNTIYSLVEYGTYEIRPGYEPAWPGWKTRTIDPATVPLEKRRTLIEVGGRYYTGLVYMPLFPTIDMVSIDKKFYSSKPPLLPTMLAGLVWAIQKTTGATFRTNPWFIMRTTLIIAQVVPLLLCIWLISRHVRRFTSSFFTASFCVAAAALATYLTPWSVTLNNHVIAACTGMIAIDAAIRIWYDGRRQWYGFVIAGFFAAMTAALELPAALLTAAVLIALAVKDWKKTLSFALVAAAVPVAAFFITNYKATRMWKPVYSEIGEVGKPGPAYDYEGSYWRNPQGIDALNEKRSLYLLNMLVGHHGFFLLTPIFFLSLIGIGRHLARPRTSWPLLAAFVLLSTAVITAYYVYKTRNYGGTAQGLRWMFWLIPFWLLFLPAGVAAIARSRIGRIACYSLFAVSMLSAGFALRQPWGKSWAHVLFYQFGWIDY